MPPHSRSTNDTYTLWGTPHSLYTGKARSYLLKKGIGFRELTPAHPDFKQRILPVVGVFVVPVLETPEGEIIQDCSDIIDHLESRFPANAMLPATPVQRVVALLLDGFGSEGMLANAMHYRWTYRAQQENFLAAEFGRSMYSGPDRAQQRAAGAAFMEYFNSFLPPLGITAESIPAFEAAHEALLDALDIHFQQHPYLLGGHPSIGDFGFMAALYAHLGRDPVPASLMKNKAPNVYRWTERMNRAAIVDCEFPDTPKAWLADDAIPASLEPVLALLFGDWGPMLNADTAAFNAWLTSGRERPAGTPVNVTDQKKVHPSVGWVDYTWRGCKVTRESAPHGLWMFAKAQQSAGQVTGEASKRLTDLVRRTGGESVMDLKPARRMGRVDYTLVLL